MAAAVTAAAGGWGFAAIYGFEVTHHRVPLPGLRSPLRVVQLSDLHYGPYLHEASVARWVDAALAESPDLLVLTGDYVDSRNRRPLAPLLAELVRLRAPLGVHAVWGNHDHFNRARTRELAAAFAAAGITVLNNSSVPVRDDLLLAGIDDFKIGRPDLAAALAAADGTRPTLLLSHNPDLLPELPAGSVALALAGHTHGGQVRLPLLGAPVTSSSYGQRLAQGWVDVPVRAYVCRGLGVTGIPMRVLCPPELAVFDLVPV